MIVFISGPIAGVEDYRKKFKEAEDILLQRGHAVINPAGMDSVVRGSVEYDDMLKMDLKLLECAEAICLLPGWENSKGARAERARAKELRLTEMIGVDV